ncbi:MAG: type II toxin-antitoxin system RelE/ParE family toxin [Verrucomicrobiota bacterium]
MNTFFRESFDKDLSAVTDAGLLRRIQKIIEQVEAARTLHEIPNLKRLEAKGKYFRIRLGDYRVGFVFEQGAVTFVRCLHRREIYRYFP